MRQEAGHVSPYSPLSAGKQVSIQARSRQELAARVAGLCSGEIRLELLNAPSEIPFQKGDRVHVKYWEEGVIYCWEGEVSKLPDQESRWMGVSVQDAGLTVQRRKSLRIELSVPLSLVVADARKTWLIGKTDNCKTQDIGVGGVRFETRLPVELHDKLALKIQFSPSQQVNASAWVVRVEPVDREGKPFRIVAAEFLLLEEEDQRKLLTALDQAEE